MVKGDEVSVKSGYQSELFSKKIVNRDTLWQANINKIDIIDMKKNHQ